MIRTQLDSLCRTLDLDFITTHRSGYAGFSSPHLVNYDFNSTQRHYFIIGGAIFDLNEELKLRPSTYLKLTENAPITMDLTALLIMKDRIWLGGAFRAPIGFIIPTNSKGGGFGLLAGLNINDQLSAGYSFGFSMGNRRLGTMGERMRLC